MRITLMTLFLAINTLNAQKSMPYYPHTRDLLFKNEDEKHNAFIYEKAGLITELKKMTEKVFYSTTLANYSNTGTSLTQRLDLIPLRQNIENIFSTGVTLQLRGDKENHIGIYYKEEFRNDDQQQQMNGNFSYMASTIELDKPDKVALSFPMQMLNPFITDATLRAEFFISKLSTVISKDKKVILNADGKFNKAFYLKDSGVNSLIIKNIVFELINDEVIIKAIDPIFHEIMAEYPQKIVITKVPFQL
ncbi:hypothetical protein PYS58_05500 [Chryseobacterium indologenes]|uniref:hypothetical protein n=1 Tax=Chryseobacterium indologenes TaxID=253 RepID=UPI0023E8791C|nr:hypothetical protein [Chryseobacterium indologenes]WET50585.1 hypothetical protein PYS58_05500 [Chryseobacterium indologenes]